MRFAPVVLITLAALVGCGDTPKKNGGKGGSKDGRPKRPPNPTTLQIEALIARFGAKEWNDRDQASRALELLGALAQPTLKEARPTGERPRRRVRETLARIESRRKPCASIDAPPRERRGIADDDLPLLVPFAKTLRHLDLSGTGVTDAGMPSVAKLTALQTLDLADTKLTADGLEKLSALSRLRCLDLTLCRAVTNDAARWLVRLGSLVHLDLSGTAATGETLVLLRPLAKLRKLHLRGCQITDGDLAHLRAMRELQHLDLTRCAGLTPAAVAKLRRDLPKCKVVGP